MSATEARYGLLRTKRKYLLLRTIETLLLSLAVALIIGCLSQLFSIKTGIAVFLAICGGLVYFILRSLHLHLLKVREKDVVQYINQHYAQMEESADLLIMEDHDLTSIQQLQKRKSIAQFESLYPSIKLPNNFRQAIGIFFLSIVVYFVVKGFYGLPKIDPSPWENSETFQAVIPRPLAASIKEAVITLIPPSYTGLQKQNSSSFSIHIPEGTRVEWSLTFTEPVIDPHLIFSGRDSVTLAPEKNNQYKIQRSFGTTSFYQVAWKNNDGSRKYSDYFQVEMIKDQPPGIIVENLHQFIELSLNDNLEIDLKSTLTDDYGLRDAYIIATVSKGSGEAVKFREEKLRFDKGEKIAGPRVSSSRSIDILKLGLEAGDELYFYVEALDNKAPIPNRARTETFFISLEDTASLTTSVDPGLGVDLMPEYFRSQRQIIMDSEKLLKEKKKITKESFNSRSNELGYDQKVLRLRYGEFLGEEFESGIGPQDKIPDAENLEEEDLTKKYGHVHDKDNEHNVVEDKKSAPQDTHHHEQSADGKGDPAKGYMHVHDNMEDATFFTQSIRAKLKATLAIMWDAELYLRLHEPEKSLPFQYKALKLLKEISQDSRIYVHRTGYDPPPLKEEKRLTGDLSEIKNSTALHESIKNENYPSIRKAARYIEQFLPQNDIVLTPAIRDIFVKAGQELSTVAIEQPGRYLKSLSLLKALTENEIEVAAQRSALLEIRSSFWSVLPDESSTPQAMSQTEHMLDERFLHNLKALKQK